MKSNWISVKDRLPKLGARVIVGEAGGTTSCEACLGLNGNWYLNNGWPPPVTHWQAMPVPPKKPQARRNK